MASSLATVHNELYKSPEEYELETPEKSPIEPTEISLASGSLLESSLASGYLVPFNDMPLLLWDGTDATLESLDKNAARYTAKFQHAVGGCEGLLPDDLIPKQKSVRDLFCSKGE